MIHSRPPRVLLVEDHPATRLGIRSILEDANRFRVVGEAGDIDTAMAAVARLQPDFVVLDLLLNGVDVLPHLGTLRAEAPAMLVVVYTMRPKRPTASELESLGISAYLDKADPPRALLETVVNLTLPSGTGDTLEKKLTPRENQVFHLLGDGLDKHAISNRLGISVKTVEAHREAIKAKLGFLSAADLTRFAIRTQHTRGAADRTPTDI